MPDIELRKHGVHAMHGMRIKPYKHHLVEIVEKDPFLKRHIVSSNGVETPDYPEGDSMQFVFKFRNDCDAVFTDYNGYFAKVLASKREKELFGIDIVEDDRFSHKVMGDSLLVFSISGQTRNDVVDARDLVVSKFQTVQAVKINPEKKNKMLDELANACDIRHAENTTEDFDPLELRGIKNNMLYSIFAKSRLPSLYEILHSHPELKEKIISEGVTEGDDNYFANLMIKDPRRNVTLILSESLPAYNPEFLYLETGEKLNPEVYSVLAITAISGDRELNFEYANQVCEYFADRALLDIKAPRYFIDGEIQDLKETLINLELEEEQ